MTLAAKLQLKPGQSVSVVGKPASVEFGLGAEHPLADDPGAADAAIVFCTDRGQLDGARPVLAAAAERQALTWVAYPKAGHLGTDLNRDILAGLLQDYGMQPVRQIAVDEVWSALRVKAT
jgi:hypothetical protein